MFLSLDCQAHFVKEATKKHGRESQRQPLSLHHRSLCCPQQATGHLSYAVGVGHGADRSPPTARSPVFPSPGWYPKRRCVYAAQGQFSSLLEGRLAGIFRKETSIVCYGAICLLIPPSRCVPRTAPASRTSWWKRAGAAEVPTVPTCCCVLRSVLGGEL